MRAPLGTDCKIILQCHPEPHTFPCLPEPHTCACKHEWDAWTGTWTLDPQIKSLMLYRLSYPGSVRKQIDMPLLFLKPFIVLLRNLIVRVKDSWGIGMLVCFRVNSRTGPWHWTSLGDRSAEGELAQMVECSLSMREVMGSIPVFSNHIFAFVITGVITGL